MKPILLILLTIFTFCKSGAQNYRCIQPGVKRYFTNSGHYLRGIRVDSVRAIGGDSVFYFFRTPRGSNYVYQPMDSNGASWMGKKLIVKADGTHIFDNHWGDSIVINTQALTTSSKWVFYKDTTNQWYNARVKKIDTMTIQGALDTVKEIQISAQNITNDPFDNISFYISKNHGFVTTFDLYMFPFRPPGGKYNMNNDYFTSQASNNPNAANILFNLSDFDNPEFYNYHNFEAGDVKLTRYLADNLAQYASYSRVEITDKKIISPTKVQYFYKSWGQRYDPTAPNNKSTTMSAGDFTDSSSRFIRDGLMPEEWGSRFFYYYDSSDYDLCTKGTYKMLSNLVDYNAGTVRTFEPNISDIRYKENIGLVYNYRWVGSGNSSTTSEVMGVEKNGVPCGWVTLSVKEEKLITQDIYPNPASDFVTVNFDRTTVHSVSLLNTTGQCVKSVTTEKQTLTIPTGDMPGGIYYLMISDREGNTKTEKLVISH